MYGKTHPAITVIIICMFMLINKIIDEDHE